MERIRRIALPTVLFALLVAPLVPTSWAGPGFQDDTAEPCLGADDPFCDGDGGSGGWTPSCWKCDSGSDDYPTKKCKKGSTGYKTCEIRHEGSQVTCETSDGSC